MHHFSKNIYLAWHDGTGSFKLIQILGHDVSWPLACMGQESCMPSAGGPGWPGQPPQRTAMGESAPLTPLK